MSTSFLPPSRQRATARPFPVQPTRPQGPFPPGGVVEDPATGAAAAAFGGYLRDLRLVPLPTRVTLHQGEDMGAPSLLLVDLAEDTTTVDVSGRATRLALSPYEELTPV